MQIPKPKFRISTALLLVAIATLIIGWTADRLVHFPKQREAIHSVSRGSYQLAKISTIVSVSRAHGNETDEEFGHSLQQKLAECVLDAWRYRAQIDGNAGVEELTARGLAKKTLHLMDIESADQYFDFTLNQIFDDDVDLLLPESLKDVYPEIYAPSSDEHRAFRSFIVQVLDSNK